MSLRWRIDGRLVCAAKSEAEPDDTYIDDRLHYHLSLFGFIEPAPDEGATGLWRWREPRTPHWDMPRRRPLELVRMFFANLRPQQEVTIHEVAADVLAHRPGTATKEINNALGRMVRCGEAHRIGYGRYGPVR